jgi:exopolysaccharide biosynthesis polyprenyl glycosylphosphotransferase
MVDLGTTGHPVEQVAPTAPARVMQHLNARGFRLVQAADVVALATVLVGSMVVRHGWRWPDYSPLAYVVSFVVVLSIFSGSLYFGGLYEREPRLGQPPVLPRVARQTLAAGGLVALLNLTATGLLDVLGYRTPRAFPVPTPNLLALMVFGAAAIALHRRISNWLRTRREGPARVFLVGGLEDLETAHAHLRTDQHRARVVETATSTDDLIASVDRTGATDVMLLSSGWLEFLYPSALEELEARGVSVLQRVTGRETMYGLERIRQVGGLPFVLLRTQTVPGSRARFKRFTDLVFLALLAPVLVPLMVLAALYQVVVVGRPILFRQVRVGVRGQTFRMIKFRTMYPDAEEDGNPRLASQDDPRIISACRWLRATRLDELPQVWNVLRGDMSLVGPRPERPELTAEFEKLIPGYARRHELPPGLTGLAQIHGRYHTDPEYKLGYDLQYLVNWSPVLDLEIMARTVWVVLARKV